MRVVQKPIKCFYLRMLKWKSFTHDTKRMNNFAKHYLKRSRKRLKPLKIKFHLLESSWTIYKLSKIKSRGVLEVVNQCLLGSMLWWNKKLKVEKNRRVNAKNVMSWRSKWNSLLLQAYSSNNWKSSQRKSIFSQWIPYKKSRTNLMF